MTKQTQHLKSEVTFTVNVLVCVCVCLCVCVCVCVLSSVLHCWGISQPVLITKTTIYSRMTMTAAFCDPYLHEKKHYNEGRGRGCIVGLNIDRTFHSGGHCLCPLSEPEEKVTSFKFTNVGLLCYITYIRVHELLM